MFSKFWHTFFYDPIYNGLVFILDILPSADVGIAIILITVVVKLVLFPISVKAVRTQIVMKQIEPELNAIKKKYEKNKQEQAQKMMQLYKDKEINPFSGILLLFIQLPVIFALYWIFFKGGLPEVNVDILYSFVGIPALTSESMMFLGIVDMAGKSLFFAVGAGLTQYYQLKLSMPPMQDRKKDASMKEDFARSFQLQMRYMMPVLITLFAYFISAAIALYWLTSNLFTIGQEMVIRKKVRGNDKVILPTSGAGAET
jgi:YidC/Oxa1 family membrane protein insertase